MAADRVLYAVDGRVARVTLNRPEYRNAQSGPLLRDLDAALSRAMDDAAVRVVVVAGAGQAFSAGHDLGTAEQQQEQAEWPRDVTEVENIFRYSWDHFVDMSLRWRDVPKPTIAMVHGWCIFGGWLVASAMDLIVAADDARFLTSLLQYFSLPFDIGPRKAKEILFDNRVITAPEAAELGFVNKVVPRERLDEDTMAWARRIAENPPFLLRLYKTSVNQAQDAMGFRTAVLTAHAHYMLSQLSNSEWARRMVREGERPTDFDATPRPGVRRLIERDAATDPAAQSTAAPAVDTQQAMNENRGTEE